MAGWIYWLPVYKQEIVSLADKVTVKINTVCHWTNMFVHCELLVQRFTVIKSRFSISQHHKFKQALHQSLLHVNMYVCVHALVSSMPLQQQCFHDNNVSTCTYKITIEMKVFCLTHNCYMHSNCTNTESLHVLIATCSKYTWLFIYSAHNSHH